MPEIPHSYTPNITSPYALQSEQLDLDDSVKYTFVLVGGAFNASYWQPFGRVVGAFGHEVIHPTLPLHDTSTTFEDDTEAVRHAMKGRSNIVYLTHSRGVETTRLLSTEDLGRFVCAQIHSSGGPHCYELPATVPHATESRYNDTYRQKLIIQPGNMTTISPADARHFMYHDVENEELAQAVADSLSSQRNAEFDNSAQFSLPTENLPIKVRIGQNDRVLNVQRAICVFQEWAGLPVELLQAGHSPQLSMVNQLARLSIDYANRSRKNRLQQ